MATLIPAHPDFKNSSAESAVWHALAQQLPDNATVIHGQRLTGDDKDIEIDFLVLWPGYGIAAIEVKGGMVGTESGRWYSQDGSGIRHKLKISPLEQAMIAKHALYDYLRARVTRMPGPICDLAVLPYTQLPVDWDMPDAPRRQVLDATQMDRPRCLRSNCPRNGPPCLTGKCPRK